ncbi:DUF1850 domain-containing protein [Paenalcaligenes hominis]|uniref:DUF1850 domain-containing protein n=1 Tax=Paenalcaligenes hominis TaxID=643674 RepID=UPI00352466CC
MSWVITVGACMQWAAAVPAPVVVMPTQAFTLAWQHSIEKVRWEEDYTIKLDAISQQPVLLAGLARVTGSAAGMEPPPNAKWRAGWYEYQPEPIKQPVLTLMRSEYTADYEWCEQDQCRPLADYLPSDGGVTQLSACQHWKWSAF